MKKRIICVILSLAAVFSLVGFHATEAWFGSGENKSMQLSSGDLDFEVEGNLELKNKEVLVLPGEELELAQAIVITNYSTIDTELRVRVECSYEVEEGVISETVNWIEFVNEEGTDSKWYVDEDDGYIYYCPNGINNENRRIPAVEVTEETTTVIETTTIEETKDEGAVVDDEAAETITEATTETTTKRDYADNEIPLAGTIRISGDVPIDLQGKEMTLKFILEAKQADFLTWEQFESVSNNSNQNNG